MWSLRKGKWGVYEKPGKSSQATVQEGELNLSSLMGNEPTVCITRQGGPAAALYKTPSDTEGRGGGTCLWSFCPEALPSWVCLERSSVTTLLPNTLFKDSTYHSYGIFYDAGSQESLPSEPKVTSWPSLPSSQIPVLPLTSTATQGSLFGLPSTQKRKMLWGKSLLLK